MKLQQVLECVPNFSHGLQDQLLKNIINSINKIPHQKLLHVDSNFSANRTVITFAGEPKAVVEAAFQAVKTASEGIDMRIQKGVHPRLGAVDVLPLIPLYNMSMEDAKYYADFLSEKIARLLNIPIYAYEFSSRQNYRKTLPQIRKGEYEGLKEKMNDPKWLPDYGPTFQEETKDSILKTGAIVLGARNILVAFNVSLDTKDAQIAHKIAQRIRESGYWKVNNESIKVKVPGLLPKLRAIGWYIEDFESAQVSMNLLDFKITSPMIVWETVQSIAKEYNCKPIACELIGLIPEICLIEAGQKAVEISRCSDAEYSTVELVSKGIEYLNLNHLKPFDPQKQVLEYVLRNADLID